MKESQTSKPVNLQPVADTDKELSEAELEETSGGINSNSGNPAAVFRGNLKPAAVFRGNLNPAAFFRDNVNPTKLDQ